MQAAFFVPVLAAAAALIASTDGAAAQAAPADVRPARATFSPRSEPDAIALYGAQTPGRAESENWLCLPNADCIVRNVTRPTLTPVFPAAGTANGAAVIVIPGGGFMSLSLDGEGFRVARALAERGITAFVLKYRLKPTPSDEKAAQQFISHTIEDAFAGPAGPAGLFNPDAKTDALAALQMVRTRSGDWKIDPNRVGMMGFSAGARTALSVVLDSDVKNGPQFFGYIYGDMTSKPVPADAPPMFAAIAFDDNLYRQANFSLAQDWFRARRKVELHVYQTGLHGFGLGRPGTTTTGLLDQFVNWLNMQGFLKTATRK